MGWGQGRGRGHGKGSWGKQEVILIDVEGQGRTSPMWLTSRWVLVKVIVEGGRGRCWAPGMKVFGPRPGLNWSMRLAVTLASWGWL